MLLINIAIKFKTHRIIIAITMLPLTYGAPFIWQAETGPEEKAYKLYALLMQKTSDVYMPFLEALTAEGQTDIVRKLQESEL